MTWALRCPTSSRRRLERKKTMHISVTDPLPAAFARMKYILFSPFDFPKWLTLGFCAFLTALSGGGGSGGGGSHFNVGGINPSGLRSSMASSMPAEATNWVSGHIALIVLFAAIVFLFIIGFMLLFLWLSSRGEFMFLDGVVRNQGAVVEPWRRFRILGNSLFLFRFILGVAMLILIVVILGLCALGAWSSLRSGAFGPGALAALLVFTLTMLPLGIAFAVFIMLVHDFVVPIMYRRNVLVLEALGLFWREILAGHAGVMGLYVLMRIVLGIATGIVIFVGGCLTCCIGWLPYISSVVFLPIHVLLRCYSICFLEQYGEMWALFPQPSLAPPERDSQQPIV